MYSSSNINNISGAHCIHLNSITRSLVAARLEEIAIDMARLSWIITCLFVIFVMDTAIGALNVSVSRSCSRSHFLSIIFYVCLQLEISYFQ